MEFSMMEYWYSNKKENVITIQQILKPTVSVENIKNLT